MLELEKAVALELADFLLAGLELVESFGLESLQMSDDFLLFLGLLKGVSKIITLSRNLAKL